MRTVESCLFVRRMFGLLSKADWREELHPRDPAGKFAPAGAAPSGKITDEGVVSEEKGDWKKHSNPEVFGMYFNVSSTYRTPSTARQEKRVKELLSGLPKTHLVAASTALHEIIVARSLKEVSKLRKEENWEPAAGFVVGFFSESSRRVVAMIDQDETTPVHEFAHAISSDVGFGSEYGDAWNELWQAEIKTENEHCTHYATANAHEGFAEAYAMFAFSPESNETLKSSAPKAHAFMKRMFEQGFATYKRV